MVNFIHSIELSYLYWAFSLILHIVNILSYILFSTEISGRISLRAHKCLLMADILTLPLRCKIKNCNTALRHVCLKSLTLKYEIPPLWFGVKYRRDDVISSLCLTLSPSSTLGQTFTSYQVQETDYVWREMNSTLNYPRSNHVVPTITCEKGNKLGV